MTRQEKIKAIEEWQNSGEMHPLTCIKSAHGPLTPVEKGDDGIVLLCPQCGYFQEWVPDVVFKKWTSKKHE